MKEIYFDSSFLMAVSETPTTWFEDIVEREGKFQPVLLDCVKAELEKLASGTGRKARTARVALELSSGFKAAPCGNANVDSELVSAALTHGGLVATVDSGLAGSAKAAHVGVVRLSGGRVASGHG